MKNIKTVEKSVIWTSISIVFMTIVGELSPGFKQLLAFSGHHWVGKGIISLVLFWIFSVVFSRKSDEINPLTSAKKILWTIIISFIFIFGFYIWHYFA
tara:strand:- start:287 stop:580 length:294 start_codon:yes stop_codon:yes gene_type:complete